MKKHAVALVSLLLMAPSVIHGAEISRPSKAKVVPDFTKSRRQSRSNENFPFPESKSLLKARELLNYQTGSVAQGQLKELLYKTPSFYPCGYVYTAELYPMSGDPDLYLHEKVSGTWRKLKQSINGAGVLDSFSFTCSDITQTATNVDLDVKGYTAASYSFYLYREATTGGGFRFMEFPLHNGWTPYTATINAVLDHSMSSGANCPDYRVVAYTNEVGEDQYGLSAFSTANLCGTVDRLYGFQNAAGIQFSIGGQYNRSSGNESGYYLFYDGHTGYDYPATNGTAVYPVASGTAYAYGSANDVKVVHPNGYTTYYLHLSSKSISEGQSVTTNTKLGGVGQGHLHLTVMKGNQRVDPYGWKGPAGQDPLRVDGGDNICLWNACP